jgi:hypothetical protein
VEPKQLQQPNVAVVEVEVVEEEKDHRPWRWHWVAVVDHRPPRNWQRNWAVVAALTARTTVGRDWKPFYWVFIRVLLGFGLVVRVSGCVFGLGLCITVGCT